MRVGIKKCGIMCLGDIKIKEIADAGQRQMKDEGPPCLGGEPVPIVDHYVYLGVWIDRYLDPDVMAVKRIEKAMRASFLIKPLLRDKYIPVGIRSMVLQAVVGSSLLYGSEIWGMNADRCKKAQKVLNEAVRLMMGGKAKDTHTPIIALWRELRVPPVRAEAAARRARACFKFPSLKTWIGVLCNSEVPSSSNKWKVRSWMTVTKAWLSRHNLLDAEGGDKGASTFHNVLDAEWGAAEKCNRAHAADEYLKGCYAPISFMGAFPPLGRREQVRLGSGMRLLSLCRIGSFWTASSLAKAFKKLKPELEVFEQLCPCCGAAVFGRGEDITARDGKSRGNCSYLGRLLY